MDTLYQVMEHCADWIEKWENNETNFDLTNNTFCDYFENLLNQNNH